MDIDEVVANAELPLLYVWAEPDSLDHQKRGRAKAEIERRRREYEESRDEHRQAFENDLFNAAGVRDAKRKEFEQRLAKEQMTRAETVARLQMEHAATLAEKQDKTAKRVAWATIFAAVAAGFSAAGAVVEVIKFFGGH